MSTVIIIGGNGKVAVQKLVDNYHSMSHEGKAAAVALIEEFIADVDRLCEDQGDNEQ